ncbi:MAG TPA: hypothetical protein VJO12_09620 [Stellaceae bacterium]|nr:hypothetical protein [Stellaceae bacterium]
MSPARRALRLVSLPWRKVSTGAVIRQMSEGFSVFYEDADDRIGTRLGGVVVGRIDAGPAARSAV